MFIIDQIILAAGVLILAGILSSKLSARIGLPVLVLFLFVGMVAGEAGLGGLVDAQVSHALGSLALALILFDGGLQTSHAAIRSVWKPSAILATVGVLITAVITGVAACYILGLSLIEGLLVGAIVGSTDAAAVFAVLRNAGIHINYRLKSILEVESASNDPMAIFLTVGVLEVLTNDLPFGWGLLQLFVMQMGIGALLGLAGGWLAVRLINVIRLEATGLYPVLIAACGLLTFGVAANLGGSGFLAIFVAGVVIGNSHFVFQRNAFMFHDGLAWLSQITMFVVLGLLVDPRSLLDVWLEGLLIAAALTFVARPVAVVPVLKFFGYNPREITLVSWVGLRGSVPIILAVYPFVFGYEQAPLIFNVVFFVVLLSATIQGSTLPWVARKLNLMEAPPASPAAVLEITSVGDVDADIVEYTLGEQSRAVGRRLSELALPSTTVVAMITRGEEVIAPRGSTKLRKDDHLFAVLRPRSRAFVDCVFSQEMATEETELPRTGLKLKGSTRVRHISDSYGITLPATDFVTLDELLRETLTGEPEVGAIADFGEQRLEILEIIDGRIATVGLHLAPSEHSLATEAV